MQLLLLHLEDALELLPGFVQSPFSGIWAKEEMINPTIFPPGSTHSTFVSNPMGTSVVLETLKMFSEMTLAPASWKGAHFLDGLKDLQSSCLYQILTHALDSAFLLAGVKQQAGGRTQGLSVFGLVPQEKATADSASPGPCFQ